MKYRTSLPPPRPKNNIISRQRLGRKYEAETRKLGGPGHTSEPDIEMPVKMSWVGGTSPEGRWSSAKCPPAKQQASELNQTAVRERGSAQVHRRQHAILATLHRKEGKETSQVTSTRRTLCEKSQSISFPSIHI